MDLADTHEKGLHEVGEVGGGHMTLLNVGEVGHPISFYDSELPIFGLSLPKCPNWIYQQNALQPAHVQASVQHAVWHTTKKLRWMLSSHLVGSKSSTQLKGEFALAQMCMPPQPPRVRDILLAYFWSGDALRNVSGVVLTDMVDMPAHPTRLTVDWKREISCRLQLEPGGVKELPG